MSGTGATKEQFEAAKEHARAAMEQTTMSTNEVRFVMRHAGKFAEALVPPDHRIVGTAERAAIGRIVEREREDRKYIGPFLSDDDLALLARIAEGAER